MSDEPSNATSDFYRNVCAFLSDRAAPPEDVDDVDGAIAELDRMHAEDAAD